MKKIFLILALMLTCQTMLYGEPDRVILRDTNQQHNHNNLPLPADMPDVYYDGDNQQIIIDGPGVVGYYDVEISSATNWYIYISTQVSGSYDTIDISSLPQGEYVITIDSPTGNTYEGFFGIL
jgi:hypothetical protein